jgi:hypothetical protein
MGSLRTTGIETLDKSFPIFRFIKFHRLKSSVLGLGVGSFVRRPVVHLTTGSGDSVKK